MADEMQSFEATMGGESGDMLSMRRGDRPLKIGVLACAYFEYWRMYDGLLAQVAGDMDAVAARIGRNHEIVYPGLVDTLDKSDAAGKQFNAEQIDLLVITEGTYCTDYIVHQAGKARRARRPPNSRALPSNSISRSAGCESWYRCARSYISTRHVSIGPSYSHTISTPAPLETLFGRYHGVAAIS